tara:strand:- start:1508 stop:1816 length:309 start_codon:yes stop_codon:yes gene_type:complete
MDKLNSIETLGFFAGVFTTVSFLPQVIKTWKSKSADDVSVLMFILFISGVFLWCIYGWEIHSSPIIIANSITFILAGSILFLKIRYENSDQVDRNKDDRDMN